MIIPTLISGATGILNSVLGRKQSQSNTANEIAYAREAADLQHKRNVDMWRMNNLYNSPTNQMSRLKEAGLNPRLMYGSAGNVGNSSSPPSSYNYKVPDMSKVQPFQMPDGLGAYVDYAMKQAQVDAIEAQTSLTQQREANEAVELAIRTNEAKHSKGYYSHRRQKMAYDARKSLQAGDLGRHSYEMAELKLEQAKLGTKLAAERLDLTKEQVMGQKIKNDYEKAGISPNTPYQARLLFKKLQEAGLSKDQIATALLTAGVGSDVLKTLLPAGILGKALKGLKVPSKSKTRYNSNESWRNFEQRRYE